MADNASTMLESFARVALRQPDVVMKRLCAHFVEHGEVTVSDREGRISLVYGTAMLEADGRNLNLRAEGRDEAMLAYVKLAMAEHIIALAPDETPRIVWQGDDAAGRPLPYFREMCVVGARNITPHMRRVTLRGNDLRRFSEGGFHVRLLIPHDRSAAPVWPVMGEDGRPRWPGDDSRQPMRIYTIRNIDVDKGEIDIDFVLHDGADMPGARFAREARPGDLVGMTGPGGGGVGDADWYLLGGDETALPAIGRILDGLPATARAVVHIEVADAGEEQALASAAHVDLRWLHRNGAEPGTSRLLEAALRDVDWPQDGTRVFAWAGCEYASFRAIRKFLRDEKRLAREQQLVVAYWRRNVSGDNGRSEEE